MATTMMIKCFFAMAIILHAFPAFYQAEADTTQGSTAVLITVDQSGKGDYKRIQDAIDAVPSNNVDLVFIRVKPGVYEEKISVPADKPFITVSGTKANDTIITWNDGGEIFESPTFSVLASDFIGRYLTIQVYLKRMLMLLYEIISDSLFFLGNIDETREFFILNLMFRCRTLTERVAKLWR